ncbi:uncharacterized protein TNCV_1090161 [Trichonephila clavipes]|uniref:Pre-C2HC domain-containing protein n=1 Tax=Trichonephila clavipes TaxID=2585209 RepID=A0A8X6VR28_TRICX|nr:uncharacterized protein TNCV_1090161 [Trichonephila clavipes]
MSDIMDFSPTQQIQVAAYENLRDTVHGISALHSSMFEDVRSPSPKNSYMELYQMSTQAMARKKDEMESNFNNKEPTLDEINVCKVKKKKPSKKRKNKGKEFSEEFIFPKKTARPVSPTSTQDLIETKNNFSDLEQGVEDPLPTVKNVNSEEITPPPTKLPHPVMLKIKNNFREQIKLITEKFPKIRNRTVGDVVKMFTNDHDEYRFLIHFLKTDKEFEFYVIDNKKYKPIKAVIKDLPSSSKITDTTNDLADEGYQIESCTQLISKRTKKSLPFFLVILPRNAHNSKIFDLTYLGYLQVKVEGYLPKKGTLFADPKKKRNFATKWIKEGISFANVVRGEVPNQTPIENGKEDHPPWIP